MRFDLLQPEKKRDAVYHAGMVALPSPSHASTQLYSEKWGVPLIRPVLVDKIQSGNLNLNLNLNMSAGDLLIYTQRIKLVLEALKKDFQNVFFIDFRIDSKIKSDAVLNINDFMAAQFSDPIINNMKTMPINSVFDGVGDLELLRKVCAPYHGIHGLQIIIAERLFNVFVEGRSRAELVFEETIIFSHLSLTGKL